MSKLGFVELLGFIGLRVAGFSLVVARSNDNVLGVAEGPSAVWKIEDPPSRQRSASGGSHFFGDCPLPTGYSTTQPVDYST